MKNNLSSILRACAKFIIPQSTRLRIRTAIARKNFASHARKSWYGRKNSSSDDHVDMYWKTINHPNRQFLIKLILEALSGKKSDLCVLEYGSHVGANIKLLNDTGIISDRVGFYCVEPNVDAVNSLKENLPFVKVLLGGDEEFLSSNFPDKKMDLSFVNAVFYCVDEKRSKRILQKLASISDVIIIGDELENLEGERTVQQFEEPFSLRHPYKTWLKEYGFQNFAYYESPVPKVALNGFLVASKIK